MRLSGGRQTLCVLTVLLATLALANALCAQDGDRRSQTERNRSRGRPNPSQGNRANPKQQNNGTTWRFLAEKYDKDKDGIITPKEYDRRVETFVRLDADGNNILTKSDFNRPSGGRTAPGRGKRQADAALSGRQVAREQPPKVGEVAPDFKLPLVTDPSQTIQLSSFAGEKPVALIFGSYT